MTEEQMSMMKKLIKKHGIGATDGEWSLVYLGVRYGLSEQQVDEYLTLDTTELLLKHEKMLCIILGTVLILAALSLLLFNHLEANQAKDSAEEVVSQLETAVPTPSETQDDTEMTVKEIDGYELVQNKIPENKDGKYEEETIVVTYYYNKIETPQTGDINVAMYIAIALVSLGVISKKVIFKKI